MKARTPEFTVTDPLIGSELPKHFTHTVTFNHLNAEGKA
jgi:hypothetical protein